MKKILIALFLFCLIVGAWAVMNHNSLSHETSVDSAELAGGIPASELDFKLKPNEQSIADNSAGFLPTSMSEPELFKSMQDQLTKLTECFGESYGQFNDDQEINLDSFRGKLEGPLGQISSVRQLWSTIDIKTEQGELRRLVILYSSDQTPIRSLRYWAFRNNAMESLPVDPQQASGATDEYIASLENQGQLISKSSAQKWFFSEGAEADVVDKDGKIHAYIISDGAKSMNCTNADSTEVQCNCN